MTRDSRRDRGQWRGCHTFKDIICDEQHPGTAQRNGGLSMGQSYYFYYEIDGSFETHDTSLPSTSACPYLPGQSVNVMVMPAEVSNRTRTASLSSMRYDDFMTMDPGAKFSAPRRAPPPPALPEFLGPRHRLPTAHASSLKHKASNRSLSPGNPNWWSPRKLFTRKYSATSSVHSDESVASETSARLPLPGHRPRSRTLSPTPSRSTPQRSMSPESLRRFLCDDTPRSCPDVESAGRPENIIIPEVTVDDDDDDEFTLASAASEFGPRTILSPPPPIPHRERFDNTRHLPAAKRSVDTLTIHQPESVSATPRPSSSSYTFYQEAAPEGEHETPRSRFSLSSDDASVLDEDEVELNSQETSVEATKLPSFYHSDAEDDDDADCLSPPIQFNIKRAGLNMGRRSMEQTLAKAFEGYGLPRIVDLSNKSASSAAQDDEAALMSNFPLLALPTMGDFASEFKSVGLI